MLQLLSVIPCYMVVCISMVPLLFVIPFYNCFDISMLQLPFVFPRDNFRLYFEPSVLTVLNHFKIQQILTRLSFMKVVALRLHEPDPTAVFCPFCIPWRLSNRTRQSKLLSTGEC